jgi:hypothetical protein
MGHPGVYLAYNLRRFNRVIPTLQTALQLPSARGLK